MVRIFSLHYSKQLTFTTSVLLAFLGRASLRSWWFPFVLMCADVIRYFLSPLISWRQLVRSSSNYCEKMPVVWKVQTHRSQYLNWPLATGSANFEHISTRVPLGHSMWIDGLTETGTGKWTRTAAIRGTKASDPLAPIVIFLDTWILNCVFSLSIQNRLAWPFVKSSNRTIEGTYLRISWAFETYRQYPFRTCRHTYVLLCCTHYY